MKKVTGPYIKYNMFAIQLQSSIDLISHVDESCICQMDNDKIMTKAKKFNCYITLLSYDLHSRVLFFHLLSTWTIVGTQLFTTLLVMLFSRDKRSAGRYVTHLVIVIMFVLPFGAVTCF